MTTSADTEDSAEVETVETPPRRRLIYAYTIPGKKDVAWNRMVGGTQQVGVGLIKVGETTKPTAFERIKQQLGTAFPGLKGVEILLEEEAQRVDGSWFGDRDVHDALVRAGIKRDGGEYFQCTLDEVKAAVVSVRNGTSFNSNRTFDFPMRPEQEDAVALTAGYFLAHANDNKPPKFLWNAKMRFGKTFTTYQLARELGWTRILVLTYKPAVQSAWKEDLIGHADFEGWHFVDRNTPVQDATKLADGHDPLVWFTSFQDLGGKNADGQIKERNEAVHLMTWDCIVLDEYHFGAWRDSARELYDPADKALAEIEEPEERVTEEDLDLKSENFLYLSGTPFRAITNGEFNENATFNWTYVQEQSEKTNWDPAEGGNPYIDLPAMQMYAYEIGAGAAAVADEGEFNGFSLTEYFKAQRVDPKSKSVGKGAYAFKDPTRVSEFLEMLRGKLSDQMKMGLIGGSGKKAPFPYESPDFTESIRHSVWLMSDVASCYAMRDMLQTHPYFKGFVVHVAAGSAAGVGGGVAAKPPVEAAIELADSEHRSGSITLSCGKLMTGVTIRQWGAILMLTSLKSPESYFQSAFRVQSPWSFRDPDGSVHVLKDPVYVFEFDPNRALTLIAEYGMRLAATGDVTPQQAIGDLINYLPIFSYEGGQMRKLDAADILNIATTGIGASALAARWNSPLLVEVNEYTLTALLSHPDLLKALEQIEDFRNLSNLAQQVVTSTKKLKKAKRENGGILDPADKKEQKESASARKQIREKLQKFLAKIPVFMYVTDFREEALKDIIESLDSALFTRVTGLSVDDFRLLNALGVFNPAHMNAAIYQFKAFEDASLHYADAEGAVAHDVKIGLWDKTVTVSSTPPDSGE